MGQDFARLARPSSHWTGQGAPRHDFPPRFHPATFASGPDAACRSPTRESPTQARRSLTLPRPLTRCGHLAGLRCFRPSAPALRCRQGGQATSATRWPTTPFCGGSGTRTTRVRGTGLFTATARARHPVPGGARESANALRCRPGRFRRGCVAAVCAPGIRSLP
jgi:hypothetical protein